MRSILMIVTTLVLIGCNNADGGGGNSESTTPASSILVPLDEELKSNSYNNKYLRIPNTKDIDYALYRRHWNRVNGRFTSENKHHPTKTVELNLDDLSFNDAFNIEYCAKGEGQTFWWKGNEYTTDLLTHKNENPSVDEE